MKILKSLSIALFIAFLAIGCGSSGGGEGSSGDNGKWSAKGTYSYDSGTKTLTLNITTINQQDDCGWWQEGEKIVISNVNISSNSMKWYEDNDPMIWTRMNGSGGNIVGTWKFNYADDVFDQLIMKSDGSISLYAECGSSSAVPGEGGVVEGGCTVIDDNGVECSCNEFESNNYDCGSSSNGGNSSSNEISSIYFPDPALKQCIMSHGATYIDELQNLFCSFTGGGINDLTGISKLTNIQLLIIENSNLSDISELSNLNNLQALSLITSNITDISALANLTKLENLDLYNNNISDVSAVANLTNLKDLFLDSNRITTGIAELVTLINATDIVLYGNFDDDLNPLIPCGDISVLEGALGIDVVMNDLCI